MRNIRLVVLVTIISLISLFVVLNEIAENTSDSCIKTTSETCTHFDSVSSVNYLEAPISVISPNGSYLVSIDAQTSKFSIYHSENLDVLSSGYLHPDEVISIDYDTDYLVVKNETNCYYPTKLMLDCNIETIENTTQSFTNEIIPDKLYLNERSMTCDLGEDMTNSCPRSRNNGGNDRSIFSIGDGRGMVEVTTWSPDSNRVAKVWTTRVDFDQGFLLDDADDYDAVVILGEATRWELNRSGIQTSGVVATSISEHHIPHTEVGLSEDILGLTWAPDSQSLYMTTTNNIGVFSSSGSFSNMYSFPEDFNCVAGPYWESDRDSVDYRAVPHQLSADGSTLVISCTDGSEETSVIVVFGESSNWWPIMGGVFFGIVIALYYWNRTKKNAIQNSTKVKSNEFMGFALMLLIVTPGCLGGPYVELPEKVSLNVDSSPNDENMLMVFDAKPEVPIDTIDIWVNGSDEGFWCSIRELGCTITGAEISNQGLWYFHPNNGMGATTYEDWTVTMNDDQNICESRSCEYIATVYYLGKRIDDFQIIQFG